MWDASGYVTLSLSLSAPLLYVFLNSFVAKGVAYNLYAAPIEIYTFYFSRRSSTTKENRRQYTHYTSRDGCNSSRWTRERERPATFSISFPDFHSHTHTHTHSRKTPNSSRSMQFSPLHENNRNIEIEPCSSYRLLPRGLESPWWTRRVGKWGYIDTRQCWAALLVHFVLKLIILIHG
jgi:hypothetical protein